MIHLDTNYLIGLLVKGSAQAAGVDGWQRDQERGRPVVQALEVN